ncbi:MAG: hypothetical protein RSC52_01275 [Oscillospiraceae bacterium]
MRHSEEDDFEAFWYFGVCGQGYQNAVCGIEISIILKKPLIKSACQSM